MGYSNDSIGNKLFIGCVCTCRRIDVFTNKPTFRVKFMFVRSRDGALFFFFFPIDTSFGSSDIFRDL